MDLSEKILCIKCNEGGNLLVCSENGCPLAIHEGCMGCRARFDDAGHFYCPFCWYKQAVAELRPATEYALSRKKALLIFMDEEKVGSGKHLEENKRAEDDGHGRSEVGAGDANMTKCDDDDSRWNGGELHEQSIHFDDEHKIIDADENKIPEEEFEASAGSKGQDPSLKMHGEQNINNAEEKNIQEEELKTPVASTDQEPSQETHEEEKIQEKECKTLSASTGEDFSLSMSVRDKKGFERSDPIEKGSNAASLKIKHVNQSDKNKKQTSPPVPPLRRSSRRSSSAPRTENLSNEKVESSRILKRPRRVSIKLGEHKILLWSEEEEKTLK